MVNQDGTAAGVEDFCRVQFPRLVQVLSLYCGDQPTAEDLAQETLARVWLKWRRVSQMDAPELWARRVGLNLATSWHRRRQAGTRAMTRVAAMAPAAAASSQLEEPGRDTLQLLAALPHRQRAAVVLRFFEDLSVTETARVMGCKEGTVKALTSQGLERLRQLGVTEEMDHV